MDYITLKKLALSMGEEFKVIDNVTLEAINVQRVITKEKEYCATLEAFIKSSEEEINSLENDTSSTQSKLNYITNRGSLLESSMERHARSEYEQACKDRSKADKEKEKRKLDEKNVAEEIKELRVKKAKMMMDKKVEVDAIEERLKDLKSSHAMVEMLKTDLLKQLQMEAIRTSEQSIKFESSVKMYEGMWENYKDTYQKFPLVSDLHTVELKLKLESIQLSMLKKEAKDNQRKISEFISIRDKREKSLIIRVAEKYVIREKLKSERDNLEKSIKLKRNNVEIEKLQDPQLLSYRPSSSLLGSDSKEGCQISNTLSVLMDNFIIELAKENIPFVTEKPKSEDVQHRTYLDYDETTSRGILSDTALKLPPLPVFDSPPRKIRSVGNLLSPPKEWTREHGYKEEVKSMHSMELDSNNLSVCDSSNSKNELEAKEPHDSKKMDVDLPDSDQSGSHSLTEAAENGDKIEQFQTDMPMETDDYEVIDKAGSSSSRFGEVEESITEIEDRSVPLQDDKGNAVESHDSISKPGFISDSPDFTYVPRIIKSVKMEQESAPETTSPYFVESSYLNFMDVPKEIVKSVDKETVPKEKDKKLNDDVKENIPVIDLGDDVLEQDIKQSGELNVHKTDSSSGKEYPVIHQREEKSTSFSQNESDVVIGKQDITHINDSSHGKNASSKQLPACKDRIEVDKPLCNPEYEEQSSFVNVAEVSSPQPSQMNDDLNISYGSPMNYSQMSYSDSIDYQDTYQSFSPGASSIDESPQFIPGGHGHANLFGSGPEKSGFNYGFPSTSQQSSAASLFGNTSSGNNESKERKQTELFNFSFDSKSKTPSMFKLF